VRRSLDEYAPMIGPDAVARIRKAAEPLRGARVLHVSATSFGTAIAGTLAVLVPLMQDLGMESHWATPRATEEYPSLSHAVYEGLAGDYVSWTAHLVDAWRAYAKFNAEFFDQHFDYVIVHDPQPVPILQQLRNGSGPGRWVWHSHLDLREAQPEVLDLMQHDLQAYSAVIFEDAAYIGSIPAERITAVIPPAIDPLSTRNVEVAIEDQDRILTHLGIDPNRPVVSQVSRFDHWNDALGVIDIYRSVKAAQPKLQLALVAQMAHDDIGARLYYEKVARRAGEDADIHLLSSLNMVGDLETNVIQRASTVAIQRSVRKGFAKALMEASWKCRPAVAGDAGGLATQVISGSTGFICPTVEESGARILELLRNPELVEQMGVAAHEYMREKYLITRCASDYVDLLNKLREAAA
jgi:trehalose synthase